MTTKQEVDNFIIELQQADPKTAMDKMLKFFETESDVILFYFIRAFDPVSVLEKLIQKMKDNN